MKNGTEVLAFERAFANHVGARYGIALCNGTATLHTALAALGLGPGGEVQVPPLTMASTSLAVLHAGGVPRWLDVDPDTWLMEPWSPALPAIPVALYGLADPQWEGSLTIIDAAQTLMLHNPRVAFTSYSFQATKIIALGEGGMLVTNDELLAERAREFSSLGYRMRADQPRIDPASIKSPTATRHYRLGWNYRMSDLVARQGLEALARVGQLVIARAMAADLYAEVVAEVRDWLTPQMAPDGWLRDWWAYSVALRWPELWTPLVEGIVAHGGERPYAAWRLTYAEPAFAPYVSRETPRCRHAEALQPRLLQFQTNDLASANRNAIALRRAIRGIMG